MSQLHLPRATDEQVSQPGVYVILYEDPWAVYVGCAYKTLEYRWQQHLHELSCGRHPCYALQDRYDQSEPVPSPEHDGDMRRRVRFCVAENVYGEEAILDAEAWWLKFFLNYEKAGVCTVLNNARDPARRRARKVKGCFGEEMPWRWESPEPAEGNSE